MDSGLLIGTFEIDFKADTSYVEAHRQESDNPYRQPQKGIRTLWKPNRDA